MTVIFWLYWNLKRIKFKRRLKKAGNEDYKETINQNGVYTKTKPSFIRLNQDWSMLILFFLDKLQNGETKLWLNQNLISV